MVETHLTSVTRSLAINSYQFWHAKTDISLQQWFERLEAEHSVTNLSDFIRQLGHDIDAKILNLSSTSYEPFGASAALLIGQNLEGSDKGDKKPSSPKPSSPKPSPTEQSQLAHLDASHIAAHTYFDASERFGQFRMEIELSTCGAPTPEKLIESVVEYCKADFAQIDFRIRGLNWSEDGLPILAGGGMANSRVADREFSQFAQEVPGYNRLIFPEHRGLYLELVKQNSDPEILGLIQSMQG